LAFQETFKELIVKKEEAITERKEMWCRDKEATKTNKNSQDLKFA
jgi:hypothetical protein